VFLVYRLTPFDSYSQGLVKKIEVLTVSEKNDEASMKIELSKVETGKGEPKAILKLWHSQTEGFKFKNTKKLEKDINLQSVTNNVIYKDYTIEQIAKPIRGKAFLKFKNGVSIFEGEQAKDLSVIFPEQLYWFIDSHFRKKEKLKKLGIKCLSLTFIDKVDNYINPKGIIKKAFESQYKKVHLEFYGTEPSKQQIIDVQGYYFAQTGKGDYTDKDTSMKNNKELYDLILKDKKRLLSLDNPVEFIFSHSALGVGWDNPNVFNIATLNQSYSEIKKRQEIGRGLRICVDQLGQRIYDNPQTLEGEEINLLTVIPNETYETFVNEYQSEIKEVYGSTNQGAETRNTHKGKKTTEKKIKLNKDNFNNPSFKKFWNKLSKKTEYLVSFNENNIIEKSISALNNIVIADHKIEIELGRIDEITDTGFVINDVRRESKIAQTEFAPIDIIEEISENTALAYPTVFKIIKGITNKGHIVKNPPKFIQEAVKKIRNIELDEMFRALEYKVTGEEFDISLLEKPLITNTNKIEPTPNKGIFKYMIYDSDIEQSFAKSADEDAEVICFLKLPSFYIIKTPIGDYNPDFGIVLKKRRIRDEKESEYYFVIETKGTESLEDKKSLTESEIYKIKCAQKHFDALGIETKINYFAPIKEYESFKTKSNEVL